MPLPARTEFAAALNQVCAERGIELETVLEAIRAAVLAAYRKDYGAETEGLTVNINEQSGEVTIFKEDKNITPSGFGRIAAQTAKQVILQRIREAEKENILADYEKRIGTLVNGMIQRFEGGNVYVDLGKAEGLMPPSEQVPSERYHLNQRMTFYISGIATTGKGQEILVSRAAPGLVEGLFHREVPEVGSGAVEIKTIAREAGFRSKVAVFSSQPGVDPVGSCVGQKGVRIQAVIAELGEEKIDVIQWNEDPVKFISSALSPAKEVTVSIQDKTARVIVPDDQLSLAIGREGQNVRLAAKLTGYKIDIAGKNQVEEEKKTAKAKSSDARKKTADKKTKTAAKSKTKKATDDKKPKEKKAKKT